MADQRPLLVTPNQATDIRRGIIRALREVRGTGACVVTENDQSITIHVDPPKAQQAQLKRAKFLIKLSGKTSIGSNRWEYDWSEYALSGTTFSEKTDGRNSTDYGKALNLAEAFNTGSGIEGNQVDVDDADATVELKDMTYGSKLFEAWFVRDEADGSLRLVFDSDNGVTVECS